MLYKNKKSALDYSVSELSKMKNESPQKFNSVVKGIEKITNENIQEKIDRPEPIRIKNNEPVLNKRGNFNIIS
jgi:DNA anti-recombination protein RmuC